MKEKIDDIYEEFVKMSELNKLLDVKIRDVNIWQYTQFEIYNLILTKLKILDEAHSRTTFYQKIRYFKIIFKDTVLRNPFLNAKRCKYLFFNHPRKVLVNGEYIDVYTHYLLNQLNQDEYFVFEKPYNNMHFPSNVEKNVKYLDMLKLQIFVALFFKKLKFSEEELKKIMLIQTEIFSRFSCKIDLISIFSRGIIRFKIGFNYYSKILQRYKPNAIFIVVYYSYMELISAAKRIGIKVYEIQHGIITPFSVVYNFPNRVEKLEYCPDSMIVFGEFWRDSVKNPIEANNYFVTGYPFLQEQLKSYENVVKDEKRILFVSQGTIGRSLFDIALEVANKLPDFKIIFKLHPGEFNNEGEYALLLSQANVDNVFLNGKNGEQIYAHLSQCKFIIGVYSTAIYEAIAFGCSCILVDLPGVEYMKKLNSIAHVPIAKNAEFLTTLILENNSYSNFNRDYLFSTTPYEESIKSIFY